LGCCARDVLELRPVHAGVVQLPDVVVELRDIVGTARVASATRSTVSALAIEVAELEAQGEQ
jgi:hypothetical protein